MVLKDLSELNAATRRRLKEDHRGFMAQLARDIDRNRSHITRAFYNKLPSRSRYVEGALLKRINELLAEDKAKANGKPPRQTRATTTARKKTRRETTPVL